MMIELSVPQKIPPLTCKTCDRVHTLPFLKTVTRAQEVLELVHSDICEPINVASLGGAR